MIIQEKRVRLGIRHTNPLVPLIAATTPTNIYLVSPGRSFVVRKIFITNRTAVVSAVQFGTGLGVSFAQALPSIYTVNGGQDLEIPEEQIPNVEFFANLTAQASQAGASPADVQIVVEVEEYQGVTG